MKEVNARPTFPSSTTVTIEHCRAERAYYVRFPGGGYLLNEHGQPANIGPTYDRPAPWKTLEEALAYWNRVDEAFRRLT